MHADEQALLPISDVTLPMSDSKLDHYVTFKASQISPGKNAADTTRALECLLYRRTAYLPFGRSLRRWRLYGGATLARNEQQLVIQSV